MNEMTSLFFISLFITSPGLATPLERSQAHIIPRQDSQRDSGFSPSIWIPIIVVILVLSGLVLLSWSNRKLRRLILPGNAQNQAQTTTELTAEQLAGTINNGASNATNAPQPAARTRRTRRPRRTPSQMSVTSLPAYNKEPGEQELVIFRGQDMEDVTVPTTTVISEEDGDSSLHSGEQSRRAYSPLANESPNESPVHQSEDQRPSRVNSRRSSRNHHLPHSSEESRGLMQNEHESLPHHREEAPAYFEVVDPQDSPNAPPASASSPPSSAEPSAANTLPSPPSSPERRSGIRTFFNRMSVVGAPRTLGHARGDSNISTMSSNQSHGGPSSSASHSASRHRASPSTAGSFFRTLSRQRSQSTLHSANALNSPSLISLNSISAPLTHTLTRTEFTYPKSGPTAEQIKIIASRESIARFGVPYGPDAVAFASTSMLDVTQPPPDFDSVVGAGSSSLSLNASRVSLHVRGDSGNRPMSPLAQPAVTSSNDNEASRDNHHRNSLSSNAALPLTDSNPSEPSQASSSAAAESQQTETQGSLAGHPSVASKASTTYKSVAPSTAPSVSEFGKLVAPPSSFSYDQTALSSRSESRLSVVSRQSYATAAESITTRGQASETDSEEDDDDAPVNQATTSTHSSNLQMPPGLQGTTSSRHTQEATDATVVGTTAV